MISKICLKPSAEDIDKGIPNSCDKCALALCLRRHLESLGHKVSGVEVGLRRRSISATINGVRVNWWSWLDDCQVYGPLDRDPFHFIQSFDAKIDKEKMKKTKWEFVYHLSEGAYHA